MLEKLAHWFLFQLDTEQAHKIGKWAMKHKLLAPGEFKTEEKTELFGVEINNPLGLAAGFDKNGELVNSALEYGFGYVEVGSVTYEGGKGNPKPRLFRLHKEQGLLNRMGLNGDPAYVVAERLRTAESKAFGVNIAKTHSADILGDKAIRDIVNSYQLLKYFGIYTVLNISCPNTREGRTFEDPLSLKELLSAISEAVRGKPLLLKLSPSLTKANNRLREIVSIAEENHIGGYVCGNTLPYVHPVYGPGGLSGKLLREPALTLIQEVRKLTDKVITGVGGISTGLDMITSSATGANFFQAYTGFVMGKNRGPDFAHKVNSEFYRIKARE